MKILMYDHSGCYNRGCEAIIRSTCAILGRYIPDVSFGLCSYCPESDIVLGDLPITVYDARCYPLKGLKRVGHSLSVRLLRSEDYYYKNAIADTVRTAREYDVCLLVGGDTFCYGNNEVARRLTAAFLGLGKKVFAWGCSVGEEDLTPEKIATLKSFTGVFTRESLSEEVLKKAGVERLYRFPDPAFNLETDAGNDLPEGKYFGFNVSSISAKHNPRIGDLSVRLLSFIERETDFTPLLVPHVIKKGDQNDHDVLAAILAHSDCRRAILLPGDLSAARYKGFISKCSVYMGARTHSLVAAYSSLVPAYALGYSIKAKGMAKDIFGEERYVADTSSLEGDALIDCAVELINDSEKIKSRLEAVIPKMKAESMSAGEKLRELIS